jgi:kynurenine 3-monooxygenase
VSVTPARVSVIGAGLTGCLLACRLADAGHEVVLYDRRPDPRRIGVDEGRSINLAMSTRGLDALARIGLEARVRAGGVPMHGRRMHAVDGTLTFQPYGVRPEHHLLSVSRDELNALLLGAVDERPRIRTVFGRKLEDLDLDTGRLHFADAPEGDLAPEDDLAAEGGPVVGADGAWSAVRARMQRTRGFDLEQDHLEHGYKELTIPAAPGGVHRLEPNALHIWPRGSHMLIALPNPDGSFTCTLFWPLAGDVPFESLSTEAAVERVFATEFPDVLPLMPDLAGEFLRNPVGSLVTIRCAPWHHGSVLLLGDAAHAVVPFYGQGANAAMEDCTILLDVLAESSDWPAAFAGFERRRKPDADALADLALDNYVEMRAHVASRRFLAERRLERFLHRRFPDRFVPLYTMVTFTRIPYAEAVRRARRQDALLRRLVSWGGIGLLAGVTGALAGILRRIGGRR